MKIVVNWNFIYVSFFSFFALASKFSRQLKQDRNIQFLLLANEITSVFICLFFIPFVKWTREVRTCIFQILRGAAIITTYRAKLGISCIFLRRLAFDDAKNKLLALMVGGRIFFFFLSFIILFFIIHLIYIRRNIFESERTRSGISTGACQFWRSCSAGDVNFSNYFMYMNTERREKINVKSLNALLVLDTV